MHDQFESLFPYIQPACVAALLILRCTNLIRPFVLFVLLQINLFIFNENQNSSGIFCQRRKF